MDNELDGFVPYEKEKTRNGLKNELTSQPGCYAIIGKVSKKLYVGSSADLAKRTNHNLSTLKHDKHKNSNLQADYNNNPDVIIMIRPTDTVEEARQLEQETVDKLLPFGNLHNKAVEDVTKSSVGAEYSEETRQKIADGNRGKILSEETRLKISKAHLGKTFSDEAKQKMSDAHKARLTTEEGKVAHARGTEKQKHQVICYGVTYSSMNEAARALNVNVGIIVHRCRSDKYPEFLKTDKNI